MSHDELLTPLSFDLPPDEDPSSSSQSPPDHQDKDNEKGKGEGGKDKPYHTKRPHKKSRTGCKNCKARKVKCDEVRPTCRSCRLRKTQCVYPNPSPAAAAGTGTTASKSQDLSVLLARAGSSSVAGASDDGSPFSLPFHRRPSAESTNDDGMSVIMSETSSVLTQPLFRPPNLESVDMKLLWFYTTTTANSFSTDAGGPNDVDDILKVRVVQIAFETPFLMDSLFALSCLHLQTMKQDCDPNRALAYRARSFEGYRRAVEKADPKTFPAMIANSLLLTALSSATFRDKDAKDLFIIDWMIVWRGIGLMIDMISVEALLGSGMAQLFYRPPIDLEKSAAAIPNHLLFMISSIKPGDIDYPDVQDYYETLKYLGSLFLYLRQGICSIMNLRIVTWFTFIPRPFLELARALRPRALVILAHYAAFTKIPQSIWWLQGIGARTLGDICPRLGPEWQHLLLMPQMVRHVEGALPVARILLEDNDWEPPTTRPPWNTILPPTWVDDAGRPLRWDEDRKETVLIDIEDEEPLTWHH